MPLFLYPPMLEVRAIVARFDRPRPRFVAPSIERTFEERWQVAVAMTDLFARFGRSRARHHGGVRLLRMPPQKARSIEPAVDAANHATAASGCPVLIADLDRIAGELRVTTTSHGTRMVVDDTGQTREIGKLPCLVDARGPCITPAGIRADVRVTASTTTTLSVIWGTSALASVLETAVCEHRAHLEQLGGQCEPYPLVGPGDDPVGLALLQLVLDDPSDDHARLVFADWLDTFENACYRRRARFIRDSIAGTRPNVREDVAGDVGMTMYGWSRGFAHKLWLGEHGSSHVSPHLHREPVEEAFVALATHDELPASVWDVSVYAASLGPIPHRDPQRLRKLTVSGTPSKDFGPWLATLRGLHSLALHVGTEDFVDLPELPALTFLSFQNGQCTAAALANVAPTLETLHMSGVEIDGFPRLPQLRKLTLYRLRVDSLEPFAGLPLRDLHLDLRGLTATDVARILSFETLETLGVHGDDALERTISQAIDEGALPNLRAVYGLYPWRRDLRPR